MTRKIALLRGVNVGGNNRLPMKTLVSILEGLGCGKVRTYIQSGNAVYEGSASANDISARIKETVGFRPHVFVMTAAALKKAAAANPFRKEAAASPKYVHLFFLDSVPAAEGIAELGALKSPREDFAIMARTLYLHTPEGLAGSRIAEKIDRVLGVTTTARNWNTIKALIGLAEGK